MYPRAELGMILILKSWFSNQNQDFDLNHFHANDSDLNSLKIWWFWFLKTGKKTPKAILSNLRILKTNTILDV